VDAELAFIAELSKRLRTGGPAEEENGIDRPQIESFLEGYQPDHLTGSEQLGVLLGFHDLLGREINKVKRTERCFSDLFRRVDQAKTLHELKNLHYDLTTLTIRNYQHTGSVKNLQEKFTCFRQKLTSRLMSFVEREMLAEGYGPPPSAYVWISMGAEGRREQTILTDQDCLLVYQDIPRSQRRFESEAVTKLIRRDIREKPLDESQIDLVDSYFEIFSRKMVNCLDEAGIRKCMGGVMPTNEKWRGSLHSWIDRLKQKIKYGSGPITILDIIILMDARSIVGDTILGRQFVEALRGLVGKSPSILAETAKSAVLMPVALGFLRRFRTERAGPHKGRFNLKLKGWAPLVLTIRVLAMKYGLMETNTFERIKALEVLDLLSSRIARELEEAHRTLLERHIHNQIESISLRKRFDNLMDPTTLSDDEQARLKHALLQVEFLQRLAHNVFFPGGIGR
jgi:signal-transduction protein with cAMP-binding, CBS, and nucleotidyltransferase domain